jgi:hypothetical protein
MSNKIRKLVDIPAATMEVLSAHKDKTQGATPKSIIEESVGLVTTRPALLKEVLERCKNRGLITAILLMFTLSLAHAQVGFNLGQLHHHAHLQWRLDGHVPQEWIDSVKSVTPKQWHSFGRKSGTMSNYWNTQSTGYNHAAHDRQIANMPQVQQPSESYLFPFVKFYHQWGFDSLIYTLSTHNAYLNGQHDRMIEDLKYVISQGVNITHICLDNEMWMDFRLVGLSAGQPNIGDKMRLMNANAFSALFIPNNRLEAPAKAEINKFLDYLEMVSVEVRKIIPSVTILQTVDQTSHLRGKWIWDEVQKRRYYDGITPHIYLRASGKADLERQLQQRLNQYAGSKPIYVTELNYDFGSDCAGGNPPAYVKSKQFIHDGVSYLIRQPQVKAVMVHTLWHGDLDCNGYLRRW